MPSVYILNDQITNSTIKTFSKNVKICNAIHAQWGKEANKGIWIKHLKFENQNQSRLRMCVCIEHMYCMDALSGKLTSCLTSAEFPRGPGDRHLSGTCMRVCVCVSKSRHVCFSTFRKALFYFTFFYSLALSLLLTSTFLTFRLFSCVLLKFFKT